MKMNLLKALTLGAVLAASATYASANTFGGKISTTGGDTYTSTAISYNGPQSVTFGSALGDFSVFDTLATVTMNGFTFDPFSAGTQVLNISEGGHVLNVILQTLDTVDTMGGNLTLTGTALLSLTGFADEIGVFTLSTQGGAGGPVSFSATTIASTPEPNTLFLLGTGLVSSATMLYRRRRSANSVAA